MPIAADLQVHRDNVLADLHQAHDYYSHTKAAWRIVQRVIDQRIPVRVENRITGSVITEKDLPSSAQAYVTGFLASATLQQFVSSFEDFVFGLLRLWPLAYPHRLARKQVPMSVILTATDLDGVKPDAVNREVSELSYQAHSRLVCLLE